MDTSKEYIKMCEKAKFIQRHRPRKYDNYCFILGETEEEFPYDKARRKIWIKERAEELASDYLSEGQSVYEQKIKEYTEFYTTRRKEEWGSPETWVCEEDAKPNDKLSAFVWYETPYASEHFRLIWLPRQDQLQEMLAIRPNDDGIIALRTFAGGWRSRHLV